MDVARRFRIGFSGILTVSSFVLCSSLVSGADPVSFRVEVKTKFFGDASIDPRRPWREGSFRCVLDGTKMYAARELHGGVQGVHYIIHEDTATTILAADNGYGPVSSPQFQGRRCSWSPALAASGCPFDPDATMIVSEKDLNQRIKKTIAFRRGRRGDTRVEVVVKSFHPAPYDRFPKEYQVVESRLSQMGRKATWVLNVTSSQVSKLVAGANGNASQRLRPGLSPVNMAQALGTGYNSYSNQAPQEYTAVRMAFPLLGCMALTGLLLGAGYAAKSWKK